MVFITLVLGCLLGALIVLVAEGLALYIVIVRLHRKAVAAPEPLRGAVDLYSEHWLNSASSKQGIVWFLEPDNVLKGGSHESQIGSRELKMKKGTVQVQPVKKYAKIKDHLLILSDLDGAQVTIKLLDCTILAVSSSNLSSKKWAKRYPIRLESKSSTISSGSKIGYLYFDSAWEKESWCKALRLASSSDNKMINWYDQINKDFNHYLASLMAEFPSFLKPSALHREIVEKNIRVDEPSSYSKARIFLKKLTKKASKSGSESRANPVLLPTRDTRKTAEEMISQKNVTLAKGSVNGSLEDKCSSSSFQHFVQLGQSGINPIMSDAVCDDKLFGDDGTLCWNLLLSRLFFDAERSAEINSFVINRIQKTLSNMRTPSYIGGLTCSNLDLGNLPPFFHKIRVLPMDLTEVWAVEVDIEYLGGLLLDIETRIEVCEPELEEEFINASFEQNEDTTSFFEGIEYYSNQLNSTSCLADQLEKNDDEGEVDCLKQSKVSTQASASKSKWKSILHTIAEQVSQVPLSLAIRIVSLRGTLRLHIKPPPSDQLWFGFTSMPDIDWQLESSVGERKITSSHIALLIGNRFKTAVRDSLVLPNCESICIPWMLAEKDDWAPQKVAPYFWVNHGVMDVSMRGLDLTGSPGDQKTKPIGGGTKACSDICSDDKIEKVKDVVYVQRALDDLVLKPVSSTENGALRSIHSHESCHISTSEKSVAPLPRSDVTEDSTNQSMEDSSRTSSFGSTMDECASAFSDASMKTKRVGRRARMMDLGKRMGEKLEEKRKHIEEKSRHIVEKIRENSKS